MFPVRIVVALQDRNASATLLDSATLLARMFSVPLVGVMLGERATLDICDLPSVFRPFSNDLRQVRVTRRTMAAAITVETRAIHAMLERHTQVETVQTLASDGSDRNPLASVLREGDLVVTSVDLSQRPLGRAISAKARLQPDRGGLLLVPERAPRLAGDILALVDPGDEASVATALRLSDVLDCAVLFASASNGGRDALRDRLAKQSRRHLASRVLELPQGWQEDASKLPGENIRMVLCTTGSPDGGDLEWPAALVRRLRAQCLILTGAGLPTTAT